MYTTTNINVHTNTLTKGKIKATKNNVGLPTQSQSTDKVTYLAKNKLNIFTIATTTIQYIIHKSELHFDLSQRPGSASSEPPVLVARNIYIFIVQYIYNNSYFIITKSDMQAIISH